MQAGRLQEDFTFYGSPFLATGIFKRQIIKFLEFFHSSDTFGGYNIPVITNEQHIRIEVFRNICRYVFI